MEKVEGKWGVITTLVISAVVNSSCARANICDLDVSPENGAKFVIAPVGLSTNETRNWSWYLLYDGSFYACEKMKGPNVCDGDLTSNVYFFDKNENFEQFELLCAR